MSMSSIGFLLLSVTFAASGRLMLKLGANGRVSLYEFINIWVFFGLLLYILGAIVWIFVLSKENISTVYAFTGLTFVLVIFGGAFLFGEQLSNAIIVGTILVLSGLALITIDPF